MPVFVRSATLGSQKKGGKRKERDVMPTPQMNCFVVFIPNVHLEALSQLQASTLGTIFHT